jgi:hypothetical protein
MAADKTATLAMNDPAASKPRGMRTKVKIAGIVLAIALIECVAAYLYIPSSSDATAASTAPKPTVEAPVLAPEEKTDKQTEPQEVKLGEFRVTAYQPLSNTTLRIDFMLYGTIMAKDSEEFTTLMESKERRFREQVIVTIRSADLNDLTDAGLGLIKRRILETTNKTLGKPLLQSVVFSDFSFIEQ